MFEIDKVQFGAFLLELRKEKGYTQKQLAEKLFVSDKAVSKWERGLSLPDITLLGPLADILGVTVAELLQTQRISEGKTLTKPEVDALVSGSLHLSVEEQEEKRLRQRRHMICYLLCTVMAALEMWLLIYTGNGNVMISTGFFTIEGLSLLFGAWFSLFARESLPAFYDENKINYYSQGMFRIHIIGVHFNNRNWPHVLRAGRTAMLGIAVFNPWLNFLLLKIVGEDTWERYGGYVCLAVMLCTFIPIVAAAKKNE
ncbi:helix-turn-helix domain-containing protein [Blautia producta]|uniref:helix-turn-helix domain-containing protein n=1 Tax=Blautia producta TaxID=33035 RepID=UPI0031B5DD8A